MSCASISSWPRGAGAAGQRGVLRPARGEAHPHLYMAEVGKPPGGIFLSPVFERGNLPFAGRADASYRMGIGPGKAGQNKKRERNDSSLFLFAKPPLKITVGTAWREDALKIPAHVVQRNFPCPHESSCTSCNLLGQKALAGFLRTSYPRLRSANSAKNRLGVCKTPILLRKTALLAARRKRGHPPEQVEQRET